MNELHSKLNIIQCSYYLDKATEAGETLKTLICGVDDFYDAFHDYLKNNSIDISKINNDEFCACVDLLEDWTKASQEKEVTFYISITNNN